MAILDPRCATAGRRTQGGKTDDGKEEDSGARVVRRIGLPNQVMVAADVGYSCWVQGDDHEGLQVAGDGMAVACDGGKRQEGNTRVARRGWWSIAKKKESERMNHGGTIRRRSCCGGALRRWYDGGAGRLGITRPQWWCREATDLRDPTRGR
ncbi:hypothetical protein L1987_12609 [Smallanthus sonchifolius]|uniref:Uncharacterized protein n=1 Tax=Smallanthus sonchifolius TaxID=185202 RepID=A0ACB9JGJ3_9ASTR|nr:hypothetical protein L1987_12609 [Smallanthus sonchifolius]